MGEIQAIKVEITQAIVRRLKDDDRSPARVFGVASTALGETLADMIFAAAKDEAHGRQLLTIIGALIEQRWRTLAAKHGVTHA